MRRYGGLILAACLLTSCATGYHQLKRTGGYSELNFGTSEAGALFAVEFSGNGFTSPERASDFALLRCAEVTLKAGYTHFYLISHVGNVSEEEFKTPTHTTGNVRVTTSGRTTTARGTATTYGGQTITTRKPLARNLIFCSKGELTPKELTGATISPALEGKTVFDAQFVARLVRTKYDLQR